MSEWDFLWGLEGDALMEAMSSGATNKEWNHIDEQEEDERVSKRNKEWEELKELRDSNKISHEVFKARKAEIFAYDNQIKEENK